MTKQVNMAWLATVSCILLAACGPIETYNDADFRDPTTPFDAAVMKSAEEPGTATIEGQAFSKTRGGDVKYAAGNTIYLIPLTAYARECYRLKGTGFITSCDQKLYGHARTAVGDGEGRFRFDHVKPGDWHLATNIVWEVPTGYGLATTGGWVVADVTVRPTDTSVTAYLH